MHKRVFGEGGGTLSRGRGAIKLWGNIGRWNGAPKKTWGRKGCGKTSETRKRCCGVKLG